jgi:ubiquinone/menaquinone biosynthesis C-methylase UbiE
MAETPVAGGIEPGEGVEDEGFVESIVTSYVTTLASEIRRGVEENGRTYPAYGRNEYGLPIDESEQNRNDLQHCKFSLILNGKLHLAPIPESPSNILDLGTGSGIWAIDMADKYPSAHVLGVDIAAVQPSFVPVNCQFEIDDVENDWVYESNSFDFIHAREFLLAIRDWDRLIEQSFHCLKPGGYLELSATWPRIKSDDNTLPENSAYVEIEKIFAAVGDAIGASVDAPLSWKQRMEKAGFADVQENVFKVPTSPWPKDPRLKKIGAFELANVWEGAEALIMRGYTTVLGGLREEALVLAAKAREEIKNPNMHSYIFL